MQRPPASRRPPAVSSPPSSCCPGRPLVPSRRRPRRCRGRPHARLIGRRFEIRIRPWDLPLDAPEWHTATASLLPIARRTGAASREGSPGRDSCRVPFRVSLRQHTLPLLANGGDRTKSANRANSHRWNELANAGRSLPTDAKRFARLPASQPTSSPRPTTQASYRLRYE
jgi:hypothetical protein